MTKEKHFEPVSTEVIKTYKFFSPVYIFNNVLDEEYREETQNPKTAVIQEIFTSLFFNEFIKPLSSHVYEYNVIENKYIQCTINMTKLLLEYPQLFDTFEKMFSGEHLRVFNEEFATCRPVSN